MAADLSMRELAAAVGVVDASLFNLEVARTGEREIDEQEYMGIHAILCMIAVEAEAQHDAGLLMNLMKVDVAEFHRVREIDRQYMRSLSAAFKKNNIVE